MMSRFYRPVVGFTVPGMQLAALTLAILTATGCSVQAPDETVGAADDVELALASEVEEERRVATVNNIVASASFDPVSGQLIIAGQLPRRASVQVFSGATNQSLGVASAVALRSRGDDDDNVSVQSVAPWQLIVPATAFTTVPCTIRLETPQGTVLVPVQSPVAPGQTLNCANGVTGQAQAQTQELTISRATWNSRTGSLIIAGSGALPRQTVTFLDALSGQVIGVDQANATGSFRLRLPNVTAPACNIKVVADTRQATSAVQGVPAACVPGSILGANNIAPNTIITAPSTDSTVVLGTTVNFDMVGIDPDNNIPLTYLWNFDGAAPNTLAKNTSVTFSRAGVYRVSATVTDSMGAVDFTPDVRTIIVQAAQAGQIGGSALAPNGQILLPAANTSIAAGQSVNFAATGTSLGGLSLTYIWNFGGAAANVATQNPGNVVFTKPGTYTVTMTAVDALGYSDPTPEVRVITVAAVGSTGTNLPPNGEIVAPPFGATTFQVGQSITFTATGADPDANLPISYIWDFGGAAPVSAQQTTNVVFNQAGTFNVMLYTFDSLGVVDPTPAVRTIVVQGTGQTLPNGMYPESTINSPSTDMTISIGESVSFAGTGSDATTGSALIYTWDFDGGASNTTVQNPGAVIFGKAGSYRVRLAARNSSGRVDPTPAERIVTVTDPLNSNRAPSGQITSPLNSQTVQVGGSINFAATALDPDGTTTFQYEWDFGTAAPMSLGQNPGQITFKQAGTYPVTLRVKDPSGMADPTSEVRVITVTNAGNVNEAPNSVITSPAMNLTVNMGDSVSFMGTGIDAESGQLAYQWTFSGGTAVNTTVANPGPVTFNQPGTYQISLVATDGQSLADPTPDVRTITVRDVSAANTAPDSQIVAPLGTATTVTAGQSISFSGTATDTNGTGLLSYYWDFDGAAADSTLQNPANVTFSRPGTYKIALRVTDDRGAVDLSPATRDITVMPVGQRSTIAPEGSIRSPSNDLTIGLGQSLSFSATATDGDSNIPLSYRWNFDGAAPESNAQDPGFVAFTKPGVYHVYMTVTDSTGFSDSVPEMRTVTVVGSGNTTSTANAPNATITSPAINQTIVAGQSINFMGSAIDTSGTALSYAWNFGASGLGTRSQQSPGQLVFNTPGTYVVTLGVSNGLGLSDATPESRIITVLNAGGTTTPGATPDGSIMTPSTNLIVRAGDSVHFMGQVVTTTANQPMRYLWNFGGGAASSMDLSPGDVMFSTPGVYSVMFTVTDALGAVDPTPSMRTITVNAR